MLHCRKVKVLHKDQNKTGSQNTKAMKTTDGKTGESITK